MQTISSGLYACWCWAIVPLSVPLGGVLSGSHECAAVLLSLSGVLSGSILASPFLSGASYMCACSYFSLLGFHSPLYSIVIADVNVDNFKEALDR